MMIRVSDPKAGYLAHAPEIDDAIRRVLSSGRYILGPEVQAFEREWAAYVGTEQAIGVGSGTEAIHLALRACGVGPGDVVATVSHTATATVAAIGLAGATPLLVDIDPTTFTMDPEQLDLALGSELGRRVRAVIPVHLYGHPADMPAIMHIARSHDLIVIEDCAQAHGGAIAGVATGAWGDLGAFSFYPTKNLGALGDGGALVGSGPLLARARELREYGWRERFVSATPGMNTRLDEIQAAILRVKLKHLPGETVRRQDLASLYERELGSTSVSVPRVRSGCSHVFHQYVIRTKRRDDLQAYLASRGVGTAIHYPLPVHRQPAYASAPVGPGGLRNTEAVSAEILSLPLQPYLDARQVAAVCRHIACWSELHRRA